MGLARVDRKVMLINRSAHRVHPNRVSARGNEVRASSISSLRQTPFRHVKLLAAIAGRADAGVVTRPLAGSVAGRAGTRILAYTGVASVIAGVLALAGICTVWGICVTNRAAIAAGAGVARTDGATVATCNARTEDAATERRLSATALTKAPRADGDTNVDLEIVAAPATLVDRHLWYRAPRPSGRGGHLSLGRLVWFGWWLWSGRLLRLFGLWRLGFRRFFRHGCPPRPFVLTQTICAIVRKTRLI
jgi:hypothetical protein